VLPGLSAAFMAFVVIYSLATGSLNGVEEIWGLGLTVLGLVLSFVSSGRTALFGRVPFISTGAGRRRSSPTRRSATATQWRLNWPLPAPARRSTPPLRSIRRR